MGFYPLAALAVMAGAGGAWLDPGQTVERFLGAVARGDTASATALVSSDALAMVDSLLEADPERLCYLAEGFGVTVQPSDLEGMGSRGFLRAVLSSPALAGMLAMASWEVPGFEEDGDRAAVTVAYRLLGSTGALQVALVLEEGGWRLDDYFGGAPMR